MIGTEEMVALDSITTCAADMLKGQVRYKLVKDVACHQSKQCIRSAGQVHSSVREKYNIRTLNPSYE